MEEEKPVQQPVQQQPGTSQINEWVWKWMMFLVQNTAQAQRAMELSNMFSQALSQAAAQGGKRQSN